MATTTETPRTDRKPKTKRPQYRRHDSPDRTAKSQEQGETAEQRARRERSAEEGRNLPYGRELARRLLGTRGEAVFDPTSPPEVRCRIGLRRYVRLWQGVEVRCLDLRGVGETWADAARDAERYRPDERRGRG